MAQYNHLILARREEVIDLFKNGILYPINSIKFTGSLEALPKKTKEVLKIFSKTPVIEYSINYFFLYALTDSSSLTKGVRITELKCIIPLDDDSARMGFALTPEVKLADPIFVDVLEEYKKQSALINSLKGVENIEEIFGVTDLWKSVKKFTKKQIPGLISIIMDETGEHHPKTIWEYLITYTRSHTYPNDVRGAFLDTMSVVQNFGKSSTETKDQKLTTTGNAILNSDNTSYRALLDIMAASPNFVKTADKAYKDFWKIAPLYFILMNFLSDVSEDGCIIRGKDINEFAASVVSNYNEAHLNPALLLLGLTLGQTSTYKMLYAVNREKYQFLR